MDQNNEKQTVVENPIEVEKQPEAEDIYFCCKQQPLFVKTYS